MKNDAQKGVSFAFYDNLFFSIAVQVFVDSGLNRCAKPEQEFERSQVKVDLSFFVCC